MNGSDTLKSVQMGLVTFITQTGVGIILLSSALAKEVGHDGWISVLITGLFIIILTIMNVILLRRYSDKAIYGITQLIFGKFIGIGFNVLLILYLFTASVGGTSIFNYFIRITLLPDTPSWVLAPFITLPTFYLVWQGLKNMSRFLYISMFSFVIITLFMVLLHKDIRISFLMPIGEAGIIRILKSTKVSFFAFIGFELLAFFYPMISDKNKVLKWQIIANLVSMIFFLIIIIVSTSVFGENLLSTLFLPFFNLARIYNAPVLERVDIYLIAIWVVPMACSIRSYIFAAFDGLQKVFKLRKTKLTYSLYFIVILTLSNIPKDINQVLMLIEIINIVGIGVSLFLVLCLFLSFIRRKGVNVNENS